MLNVLYAVLAEPSHISGNLIYFVISLRHRLFQDILLYSYMPIDALRCYICPRCILLYYLLDLSYQGLFTVSLFDEKN